MERIVRKISKTGTLVLLAGIAAFLTLFAGASDRDGHRVTTILSLPTANADTPVGSDTDGSSDGGSSSGGGGGCDGGSGGSGCGP